ncbi:MAG TPA: EamA family transporter [Bellilinea sp.]|nr:EamA family transporter [Bellilinea sp.]
MQAKPQKSGIPTSIWLGMLSIYVFWGSTYLAIRFAVETIPPFFMAGTRHFTAGVILYTIMRLRGDPAPTRANWRSAAIVGLLLLAGANGLVSWAEITVPSAVTALLVGSVPLWMILIDWISGRYRDKAKRPSWLAFAGVITGFIGIALLVGPNEIAGQRVDPLGAAALLIGAVLWAGGSLYSRNADLPASPLLGTGMEMIIGGLGCFVISGLTGEWGRLDLAAVSTSSVTGLIYLIVFGSLVGFASYTWLLRAAPTTLVSTYAYVNPVVAIFLGVLLADEVISPRMIVAAVIILASVALIPFTRQPVKVKAQAGAVSD